MGQDNSVSKQFDYYEYVNNSRMHLYKSFIDISNPARNVFLKVPY